MFAEVQLYEAIDASGCAIEKISWCPPCSWGSNHLVVTSLSNAYFGSSFSLLFPPGLEMVPAMGGISLPSQS